MSRSLEKLDPATEFRNIASGGANVDAQIGVVHGDVRIEWKSATPVQKAEHGESLLERGMARDAERALGDAISEGCNDSRAAYFWALATLAGRSWRQLEPDQVNNLQSAFRLVPSNNTDSWAQALQVVRGLVELLQAADERDSAGSTNEQKVLEAYDNLDPERATEILRHMDQVLDGIVLEHIDRAAAETAKQERFAGDRAGRAWKFFEPDPARPEPIPPPPRPHPIWAWLKLLAAVVGGGICSIPVTPKLFTGEGLVVGGVLLALGLTGSAYYGVRYRFLRAEREIQERMFASPMEDGLPWGVQGRAKFTEMVVAGAFNKVAPSDPAGRELWKRATREYRLNLTRQFFEVYRNPLVQRRPSIVRWLARWHAEQLARRWDPEHPHELRGRIKVPRTIYLGMTIAAIVNTAGLYALWLPPLTIHGVSAEYILFSIVIVVCLRVVFDQGCGLIASVRSVIRENEASELRYERELAEHRNQCEILADRPSDAEMATWLAHDERYLRAKAMELYQVTVPELIAHVSFSAPAENARNARTLWGTKRYTEYDVGILLMTRAGVRFAEFQLDMRTGADMEPERLSFRYDKVASVHVKTVHADRKHPFGRVSKKSGSSAPEDRSDSGSGERPMHRSGLRTIFQIVLVNREWPIEAIFDLFDDELEDTPGEAHELVARALDVSGVAGALRMMEAITADGTDWVEARERQTRRRKHRARRRSDIEAEPTSDGNGYSYRTGVVLP